MPPLLLCNSAGLQNPTSKPNTCWCGECGEDHPACNLVGVLIEGGNSVIHSPTEPSPGPVWGRVSEEDTQRSYYPTPFSDTWHLYVTGWTTATVQMDIGGPLLPLPCSSGLPAGKSRGQSLSDTKTSFHSGGTQQTLLNDRNNNLFHYIWGHLTNFCSSLRWCV